MTRTILGIAAAIALGGPVLAADLGQPVYKAPAAQVAASWTGCYVGANAGWGWQNRHDNSYTNTNVPGVVFVTQAIEPEGGFGGGQAGCNYQAGLFVWGIEGDAQASDIRAGFAPTIFTASNGAVFTSNVDERLKWFGTVRGRVGIVPTAPVLLYVTGGAAFGESDFTQFSINNRSGGHFTLLDDGTKTGWVVGVGAEWKFLQNWSAKLEYQYLNFGDIGPSAPAINAAGVVTANTATGSSFRNDYHTIRLGLNYHFGGPVVAKY